MEEAWTFFFKKVFMSMLKHQQALKHTVSACLLLIVDKLSKLSNKYLILLSSLVGTVFLESNKVYLLLWAGSSCGLIAWFIHCISSKHQTKGHFKDLTTVPQNPQFVGPRSWGDDAACVKSMHMNIVWGPKPLWKNSRNCLNNKRKQHTSCVCLKLKWSHLLPPRVQTISLEMKSDPSSEPHWADGNTQRKRSGGCFLSKLPLICLCIS